MTEDNKSYNVAYEKTLFIVLYTDGSRLLHLIGS